MPACLDMSVESFNLSEGLAGVAEHFRALATSKEIRLAAQAPGKVVVHSDRARTVQILAALLDNALGHTPSGGDVTATAKLRARWAEVTVTVTGPGIDPEHYPTYLIAFTESRPAGPARAGVRALASQTPATVPAPSKETSGPRTPKTAEPYSGSPCPKGGAK